MLKKIFTSLFPEKRIAFAIPYILGAAFFIIFPMIMLLTKAVSPVEGIDNNWIVKQSSTWRIIWRSVLLGLAAAGISLVIAFPYAWSISKTKSKAFQIFAFGLIITPILIFSVAKVFALRVSLIRMFDYSEEALRNKPVMILGMVYLYVPFMIIPLYSVLKDMPKSITEASADLGYNPIQTIFKVVLPYCLKGILSGIAMVFMLATTSLVISNTLIHDNNGQNILIGNKIDSFTQASLAGEATASAWGSTLALVTIGVVMGIYILINFLPVLFRKMKRGKHE